MECYYHPDRESTDNCAICGKSICKECGLEIAGKIYCKDCLEKIIGLGIENSEKQESETIAQDSIETEPARLDAQTADNTIYQPPEEEADLEIPYATQEEIAPTQEFKGISEDSPYNIKSNIEYSEGLESSYLEEKENIVPKPEQPQVAQNEFDSHEPILAQKSNEEDFIYPDHSYEPKPTSARLELEDKYEKYLDDLYFDEPEIPLGEQLAKDEAEYGSLTRREYAPRESEAIEQELPGTKEKAEKPKSKRRLRRNKKEKKEERVETPEEMEARIRAEILAEQGLMSGKEDGSIHNLNYQDQKEPMGILDIILTIILILVVLLVLYYIAYLFLLSSNYPTFTDALFALKNPQNVINALLTR